jgi:hypothetical protein
MNDELLRLAGLFRRRHKHEWHAFAPFKRRCVCGCEEWLVERRIPRIGEPKYSWRDMTLRARATGASHEVKEQNNGG